MHPEISQSLAIISTGALGYFIFMVREYQVMAAGMNIDGVAQMLLNHSRAFKVPTGSSATPWAFPAWLSLS